MLDGVLRILEWHLLVVVRRLTTTRLPYLLEGGKWSFAVVVVLEFPLENSAIAKVVSFLFMERAPPRLVVLPIGALTFASVGVWFGTSWLLSLMAKTSLESLA